MNQGNNNTATSHIPADTILESLLDGVLIVDTYGFIIYANKSAQELFRRTSSSLVGENFGFAVTPYEIQDIEIRQGKKMLSVQLLATIIKWGQKNVFLMTLRDVSEKKQLEEQIRKINGELRVASLELQRLNTELEEKVKLRTTELEKKNKDLALYANQLKKNYEETEVKVTFRNLELEKEVLNLKKEIEILKS